MEQFFSNLLMRTEHELKNRYMHLDYVESEIQTAKENVLNGKICLKELPLEEQAILEVIIANPEITQKEIARKMENGKCRLEKSDRHFFVGELWDI